MKGSMHLLSSLSSAMGEYLSLRTDDFKKNVVKGLSVGFSRVLAMIVIVMMLVIVLAIFAFASVILLGEAIGSLSGAAGIIGGALLIVVLILFLLRKTLFLNMFEDLFEKVIDTDTPEQGLKSFLLILVRNLRNELSEE